MVKELELEVGPQVEYRYMTLNAGLVDVSTEGIRKIGVSLVGLWQYTQYN